MPKWRRKHCPSYLFYLILVRVQHKDSKSFTHGNLIIIAVNRYESVAAGK